MGVSRRLPGAPPKPARLSRGLQAGTPVSIGGGLPDRCPPPLPYLSRRSNVQKYNQRASLAQANPNKISLNTNKRYQNLLGFTNIYFYESGLFNGLQPKKIKTIPRHLNRVKSCVRKTGSRTSLSFLAAPASPAGDLISPKTIHHHSGFVNRLGCCPERPTGSKRSRGLIRINTMGHSSGRS
jgi:hypothetical protein